MKAKKESKEIITKNKLILLRKEKTKLYEIHKADLKA